MNSKEERKPLTVAIGAVIDNERLLLIRRKKDPFRNYWCLPGGKIEIGEHPEKALVRELYEETGIHVKSASLVAILSEILLDENLAPRNQFIIFLYVVDTFSGEIMTDNSNRWFPFSKLQENASSIPPSDYELIKLYVLDRPMKNSCLNFHKSVIIRRGEKYFLKEFS